MTPALLTHETQARHRFDRWSRSSTFQRLGPWLTYVQEQVMDQIDWSNVTHLLDIACGSGWAVYEAARRLERTNGGIACGCDLSIGMLEQRRQHECAPVETFFLSASAQALPYKNNTFDAVICTAAFHHFPSPLDALREFKRVLRPGGIALVVDTCRDQSVGTWVWDRLHRWFEPGHVQYYRRDELCRLFHAAEFADVKQTELRPSFAATRKIVRRAAMFQGIIP